MSASRRLELRASPALAAAIVGAHAAAAAALWLALPGVPGALGAAGLLALGCAAAWSRALLASARSVHAIELGENAALLEFRDGERMKAALAARRYVTRYVVALPLAGAPLGRTLLVTADMLGAEEFRRLRIWALWNRLPGVAAKQLAA